jgi:hypothetical protein
MGTEEEAPASVTDGGPELGDEDDVHATVVAIENPTTSRPITSNRARRPRTPVREVVPIVDNTLLYWTNFYGGRVMNLTPSELADPILGRIC